MIFYVDLKSLIKLKSQLEIYKKIYEKYIK